jgi:sorting nexin-3/12
MKVLLTTNFNGEYFNTTITGIFEDEFIEDRRKGLEQFITKLEQLILHQVCSSFLLSFSVRVAGHPLAQNEKCLHMFLQEPIIDKNYTPGKIRNN